ncbi:rab11 family-interacting protein 2-like isoform X1 [Carcharodon carcharias]|uniref:rab11 family-interacting protein 2-like isoform X1 n=1 Tax=Carcharodon carcharias TaxID=13397 RepID=UPI001B7E636A|nr:rab11 family-interacting protein 2-like isoform X1 [Carcharodon carcharias]
MSFNDQTWFPTHLRVTVIGARDLRAKRRDGLNNCYTVIRLGNEKYMTSVKSGSLSPEWKEECTLQLPLVLDNSDRWMLHLTVKHNNSHLPVDTFLGHVALPIAQLYDNKSRRKNEWYDLQSKPNKMAKNRGQLQLAFEFLRDNMTASSYELFKRRPQSVFDKFKDKVTSLKYGMTHEILPSEKPSTSLKHHKNGKMSKSHSYVAQMDSRAETIPTFNQPEMDKQTGAEVLSHLFHSFHKNSGDDEHPKMHLNKIDALAENESQIKPDKMTALKLEEATVLKLNPNNIDRNILPECAADAHELQQETGRPYVSAYNSPLEPKSPHRIDDIPRLTSFVIAGLGRDVSFKEWKANPPTCCTHCFRQVNSRSR